MIHLLYLVIGVLFFTAIGVIGALLAYKPEYIYIAAVMIFIIVVSYGVGRGIIEEFFK